MSAFISAFRALTLTLLAACVIVAVFDRRATGLFLILAYCTLAGALLLGIRYRWRRDRRRS